MKTTAKIIAAFAIACVMVTTGCNKENNPGTGIGKGYMAVNMTEERVGSGDTPSPPVVYNALYIDITSVEVHYSDMRQGTAGWIALSTKAGIYDLLTLQNNITAAIADETTIPAGNITQVRLILGPNNSILIGGDAQQTLTVPSREIKINVKTEVATGKHYVIALAFDADKSVVVEGNGSFSLKPVIAVKSITSF
jgi:hypothetical protein